MNGISLDLPEDLSNSLADLTKTNGQAMSDVGMDVPQDYIEYERTLIEQIELAIKEADQGNFATEEEVAALRSRRWSRNACCAAGKALKNPAFSEGKPSPF
jgi:predicted transcriptional regulator